MSIEWFRDLVICILGVINIVFLILIAVLAYVLYSKSKSLLTTVDSLCQKANAVLENVETTSGTVREIFSDVKEVVAHPAAQVIAVIQGVRQGISLVSKFFKKEGEEENE